MSDFKRLIKVSDIGLNVDDDLTILNDSRYILNANFKENGYEGAVTNCLGNTERVDPDYLPTGNNTVLFALEDPEDNAIIAFCHNNNDEHFVYKYYRSTNIFRYIFFNGIDNVGALLNFSLTHQIDAAIVGNESDKYLLWTDGYNPPRIVNIQMAINYIYGGTPAYTEITENTINFYKTPLLKNITVAYVTDVNYTQNNLRKNIWQFAIRVKYLDNTFSVLSPYSEVAIPMEEENSNGLFTNEIKNNKITATFTPNADDYGILDYQLCYRKMDVGSDAVGSDAVGVWYLSDVKAQVSGSNLVFNFYNEFGGVALDPVDAVRPYDFVPDLAEHLYVLDQNVVCLAGITEGYDNIDVDDVDVVLTPSYQYLLNTDVGNSSLFCQLRATGTTTSGNHQSVNDTQILDPNIPAALGVNSFQYCRIRNITRGTTGYVISNTDDYITTTINWFVGDAFVIDQYIMYVNLYLVYGIDRYYSFMGFHDLSSVDVYSLPNTYKMNSTQTASYFASNLNAFSAISATSSTYYLIITNTTSSTYDVIFYNIGYEYKYKSFPSGTKHLFGIQYLNNGKPFYVTTDGLGVDGDFCATIPYEYQAQPTYPFRTYYNKLNWQIKHDAPIYATHYQWVYLGANVDYYTECLFSFSDDCDGGTDGEILSIKKEIFTNFANAYGGEIDYGFDIAAGDKIRFVGVFSHNNVVEGIDYLNFRDDVLLFDDLYEFDVIAVTDTVIQINNPGLDFILSEIVALLPSDPYAVDHVLLKIYRRKQLSATSGLYQAVSPIYTISNSKHYGDAVTGTEMIQLGGTHVGANNTSYLQLSSAISSKYVGFSVYNITDGSSATITSIVGNQLNMTLSGGTDNNWDTGDTYIIPAQGLFNPYYAHCILQRSAFINANNRADYTIATGAYCWRESYNVSPMYDSRIDFFGKTNFVNEFAQRRYDNALRYGGKFFDESGVNYINKFEYDDYKPLDDKYGKITRLFQRGNVFRIYQERKVTSFPTGAISSINPDGSNTYVFSDNVLGNGVPAYNDYGCSHFTSFAKNVRNSYFFDINNGCVVRDSVNGLDDVSFKMSGYFKEKAKDILDYGKENVLVLGGYDDYTGYYVISFVVPLNLSHAINDTIAFDEEQNKWKTHYSFLPQYYSGFSGDSIASFKNAVLYTHNDNAVRNNYYEQQYSTEIWVHDAGENRLYDTIEIASTGQWACPSNGDVLITFPISMQSRLVSGRFKTEEGFYRAAFLRDMLSGGATATTDNLFNGRKLRGQEIACKLKNSSTSLQALRSVTIMSTLSK